MKTHPWLVVPIVLACSFSGYSQEKPPVVRVAPESTVSPVTPESKAVHPRLAPPGVYYLLTPKSVVTDNGLVRFKAGTEVKKVGSKYRVSTGHVVSASPSEVSNDLETVQPLVTALQAEEAARSTARATPAPAVPQPVTAPSPAVSESIPPAVPDPAAIPDPAPVPIPTATRASTKKATPAPTPANPLERKAYGKKKAFKDDDGDGRAFNIRR